MEYDMNDDQKMRLRLRMEALTDHAFEAGGLNYSDAMAALDVCRKALRRVVARNEAAFDWRQFDIVQTNGPVLQFCGKVLADADWFGTGLATIVETRGGALVALIEAGTAEGQTTATVIPPSDDPQSIHLQVMDAFGWSREARAMAKQLGWDLRVEVM
jgi:hypothetical protein